MGRLLSLVVCALQRRLGGGVFISSCDSRDLEQAMCIVVGTCTHSTLGWATAVSTFTGGTAPAEPSAPPPSLHAHFRQPVHS